MEKELAHSFNIALDKEFSQKLFDIQKRLAIKIKERRNYDSSPHLAFATKFMGQSETGNFVDALVREFSNDTKWELEFSSFSVAETGNYIFLNLNNESRKRLFALHERALTATKGIGMETHSGLPEKYPYDPHISIIKLQSEEVTRALKLIEKDFLGIKISVKIYEIVRQEDKENGFSNFPTIRKINLK